MVKYIVNANRWFDKANGNTYHSVTIIDAKTQNKILGSGFTYGYGDQYRQTTLDLLIKNKRLKEEDRFNHEKIRKLIYFTVSDGLKRDLDTEKVDKIAKKGWHEKADASGKAPRHRAVQTKKKTSGVSKKPMKQVSPYAKYPATARKIAEMLTENTGINMLDSGGAYGRAWQTNQGKDFMNQPVVNVDSYPQEDNNNPDVVIGFNIFHYLNGYLDLTKEAKHLQKQFEQFAARDENGDDGWMSVMIKWIEQLDRDDKVYGAGGGVTNSYNYENILSQIIQFELFGYQGELYIMLQIHGGMDARGGYTKPQVFELKEFDYFLIAQNDINAYCTKCTMGWHSDDGGNNWYSDGNRNFEQTRLPGTEDIPVDEELHMAKVNGKLIHKGRCGGEIEFSVMDSY